MKKRFLICLITVILAVISCNDGLSSTGGTKASGVNQRKDRSQRTVIDAAKYIDFTVMKNNAVTFTRQDLMAELNGSYFEEGGNSYIKVNRLDGTVTISSDNAFYKGEKGNQLYARYVFDVDAASGDCLYLRMDKTKTAQMVVGTESFSDRDVPDLAVCLPLYGYSRNRIEVSPVMNGYIAMPSGTYWAEKK